MEKLAAVIQKFRDVATDDMPAQYGNLELTEARPYNIDMDKPLTEEAGVFPCLLYMCGSGFGGMVVRGVQLHVELLYYIKLCW